MWSVRKKWNKKEGLVVRLKSTNKTGGSESREWAGGRSVKRSEECKKSDVSAYSYAKVKNPCIYEIGTASMHEK